MQHQSVPISTLVQARKRAGSGHAIKEKHFLRAQNLTNLPWRQEEQKKAFSALVIQRSIRLITFSVHSRNERVVKVSRKRDLEANITYGLFSPTYAIDLIHYGLRR